MKAIIITYQVMDTPLVFSRLSFNRNGNSRRIISYDIYSDGVKKQDFECDFSYNILRDENYRFAVSKLDVSE